MINEGHELYAHTLSCEPILKTLLHASLTNPMSIMRQD